jgi:hypothetical protein
MATRKYAMFQGDKLLTRWKGGEELGMDEMQVLVLYLSQLRKSPDPGAAGRLVSWIGQLCREKRPCRFCQKELYFLELPNGKKAAISADGENHSGNCPKQARAGN